MTYRFVPEIGWVDWAWRLGSAVLFAVALLFGVLALRRRWSVGRLLLAIATAAPTFGLLILQWAGRPAVVFDADSVRVETPFRATDLALSPRNRVVAEHGVIRLVGERQAVALPIGVHYRMGDLVVGVRYIADEFAARSREGERVTLLAEPAVDINRKYR